ncbi:hypothetical protein F5Y09DRAFT_317730 [Xylaria sp. FL1042]|nr:hypothetical protein F5Y09DRAFT_317730 [Xylaria sp. FL1042]
MSFLRGRIFDENWVEKRNYTLNWQGIYITFPTIFDVPTPYEVGGGFYGPEDPRLIIEEGVEDAEPVVVYNLFADMIEKTRSMHIFRPFSNFSTILTINGQGKRKPAEKNWAPFFYDPTPSNQGLPNEYLHFVYDFRPFSILKCHLGQGLCNLVYQQNVTKAQDARFPNIRGWMSGGTNLVQVPLDPLDSAVGTSAYVGFPRSHMNCGCATGATYRPELLVMLASNGSHFSIDHMSEPIDFGSAVLTPQARMDPCGEGRILIAGSVASWDRDDGQDVMTLFLSVADAVVHVIRVRGVLAYVNGLFRLRNLRKDRDEARSEAVWNRRRAKIGFNVMGCSVELVQNSTAAVVDAVHGESLERLLNALKKDMG